MFSALSSWTSPWTISLIILSSVCLAVFLLIKRGASRSPTTSSWKLYIGGQGLLLFGFLLIGGVVAWLSSNLGPSPGKVTLGGRLLEFHENPSQQVVVKEQDVRNYNHVSVFTHTSEPADASATVILYGEKPNEAKREIGRIESGSDSWSRWEQPNTSQHLTVAISTGTSARAATKVDVLIFLSSE